MKHENANRVFLLNKDGKPLMPCRPRKARLLLKSGKGASPLLAAAAILFLTALTLLFVRYTFEPPHMPLFQDPLTGRYGLEGAADAESFVPLLQNL